MSKRLTERDLETLDDLAGACDNLAKYGRDGAAPLDFGGSNGSHHGKTATKLADHGLAEHRKRGYAWGVSPSRGYRGSKVYRPTAAGREVRDAWRKLRSGKVLVSEGTTIRYGRPIPKTGYRDLTDDERHQLRRDCRLEV
jgi:hypothetical protein